jgi:hypothetical protein
MPSAPSITWWLVRMVPSAPTSTPEPRLEVCWRRCCSPKKRRNSGSLKNGWSGATRLSLVV